MSAAPDGGYDAASRTSVTGTTPANGAAHAADAPRLAVIGTGGHGAKHLAHAVRLHEQGRVRLVAIADPVPPPAGALPPGIPCHRDGLALLSSEQVDVVVVCTPIHTHFAIASAAVRAGADVLLEKPTTATLDEFDQLAALAAAAGVRIQVGFQSLGCRAVAAIRARVAAGEIGEVVRYSATGAWVRDEAYWRRARWAGTRTLDGAVVADGVLTNPLAHATATALAIAGTTGRGDLERIDLDLYRANPIEADDTSVAIVHLDGPARGLKVTTAVTLAAAQPHSPYVEVVGTGGTVRLLYKTGDVITSDAGGAVVREEQFAFDDLLENLLAVRAGTADALHAPISETGAFMRLVEAVVNAPPPTPIAPEHIAIVDDDLGRHLVVRGVEDAIDRALRTEQTFARLGEPFATAARSTSLTA